MLSDLGVQCWEHRYLYFKYLAELITLSFHSHLFCLFGSFVAKIYFVCCKYSFPCFLLVTLLEKSDILNESEKENLTDMINCRISTPFTNCVIVHLSNGWNILKSYNTTIAMRKGQEVIIDSRYYNYSASTGKHRNYFLGETLKDTDKKIKNGEYQTADLN